MRTRFNEKHFAGEERPKNSFIRRTLLVGLMSGVCACAPSVVAPSAVVQQPVARAETPVQQQDEYREVGGRKLRYVKLDKTLAEMDRETQRYWNPNHEHMPWSANNYTYSNDIVVPGEVTFVVALHHRDDSRVLAANFPAVREADSNAPGAGLRAIGLNDFNSYVRSLAGRDIERIKFIIETGTFQYDGRETNYTNLYMLPLDLNGNILTRRGRREYIAADCSYFADRMVGGFSLLVEPTGNEELVKAVPVKELARRIGGRWIDAISLDKTFAELSGPSASYSVSEQMPGKANGFTYSSTALVPGKVSFQVSIGSTGLWLKASDLRGGQTKEAPLVDLSDFSSFVKTITGREMKRVKLVVDSPPANSASDIYVIPLDENGNIIGGQGNGGYIAYAALQEGATVNGGTWLLIEPAKQSR